MPPTCDLVLPCRDEGPALRELLPRVPSAFSVIVVDNGSRDDTAAVARELGARVVTEPTPGYGAAVHAGVVAATAELVAVMDGDGSFDPDQLLPMLERGGVRAARTSRSVGGARCVAACGRGTPALGNALIAAWLRRRIGMAGPRHRADAGVPPPGAARPRPARPPLRLPRRAAAGRSPARAGASAEHDVDYHPRAPGTRSKVSGSVVGTVRAARDFASVLR